jgi:hypothetical protein
MYASWTKYSVALLAYYHAQLPTWSFSILLICEGSVLFLRKENLGSACSLQVEKEKQ